MSEEDKDTRVIEHRATLPLVYVNGSGTSGQDGPGHMIRLALFEVFDEETAEARGCFLLSLGTAETLIENLTIAMVEAGGR